MILDCNGQGAEIYLCPFLEILLLFVSNCTISGCYGHVWNTKSVNGKRDDRHFLAMNRRTSVKIHLGMAPRGKSPTCLCVGFASLSRITERLAEKASGYNRQRTAIVQVLGVEEPFIPDNRPWGTTLKDETADLESARVLRRNPRLGLRINFKNHGSQRCVRRRES